MELHVLVVYVLVRTPCEQRKQDRPTRAIGRRTHRGEYTNLLRHSNLYPRVLVCDWLITGGELYFRLALQEDVPHGCCGSLSA